MECRQEVCKLFFAILVFLLTSHVSCQTTTPTFVKRVYRGTCQEGSPIDTVILTVFATDGDSGPAGEVDYSIQDNPWFKIDNIGAVKVKSVIDAEDPTVSEVLSYVLTATDRGTPSRSGTTTLSIQIGDKNEARPRWEKRLYFSDVYHGDNEGTIVLTVKAVDKDRDSSLTYDMLQVIPAPYLQIDSHSGEITVSKTVDYGEVTQFYGGGRFFQFRARVRDGRYLNIVTVIIRVHASVRPGSDSPTTVVPVSTTTFPGCTIGDQRYNDGERNPVNSCEICTADANSNAWSDVLLDLRLGGQASCAGVCNHLVSNVPGYLSFLCGFPFSLPVFVIDSICYVKDINQLSNVNCPGAAVTVTRLSALCDYQNVQAAILDKAVCP